MKKPILIFMLCIGGAVTTVSAQTYMNVHHSGGINGYDTDLIPTVTFTNTDVEVNGVSANHTMNNVSKITFGANLSTSINDENFSSAVAVYPNPTSGVITLNIANNTEEVVVHIYNIVGAIVSSTTYKGEINEVIDFSTYENGIYMMVINRNNKVVTKKIIKN